MSENSEFLTGSEEETHGIRKDLRPTRESLEPFVPKASWWAINPTLANHGIHDIGHATRTLIWSVILANSWEAFLREESGLPESEFVPVNRRVLRLASAAHDIGRRADVEPFVKTHAHVGAKLFHETWHDIDPTLKPDEVGKIEYLLYHHCGEPLSDKAKTIARRLTRQDKPHGKHSSGIPAPVELELLRMADGGLEAFRVYEKSKATLAGRAAIVGVTALSNQFAGTHLPHEYVALRNNVWLPGTSEKNRPGAGELVPLAMQLYRESVKDKDSYSKDPFNTTLTVAERLGIIQP